jgi:tRNA(adenine34) deaminase
MNSLSQDEQFMQMALEQARQAETEGEVPVGAVVVREGRVVAVGRNQPIHCNDPTAHAEIVALRAAAQAVGNYRLEGCTLYVTLEPCAMCAGAILQSRVRHVVYGADEPKMGAAGSVLNLFAQDQLNHHTSVTSGVLSEESNSLLTNFFAGRRRARQSAAQPLREDALRTPADCFESAEALFPESKYLWIGDKAPHWRLHYADAGPKDAAISVLLVHDVPGWAHRWATLLPFLADAGVRVLAPDLLGFGRSDKPKKKQSHSEQLHLHCLDQMVSLIHPESRVIVIGQGLGTQLASCWALRNSTPISELIAIAPSLSVDLDHSPHPNRGFTAGIDFFTEWAQIHSSTPWTKSVIYPMESLESILKHLKQVEGAG